MVKLRRATRKLGIVNIPTSELTFQLPLHTPLLKNFDCPNPYATLRQVESVCKHPEQSLSDLSPTRNISPQKKTWQTTIFMTKASSSQSKCLLFSPDLRLHVLILCSFLGTETVILSVGPKRTTFTVHKDLLTKSSEFFRAGFNGNFREGKEGVMYMPEDSPGAVALFIEWLYRGRITAAATKSRLNDLYELYCLTVKLMIVSLMDDTMDMIREYNYEFNQFISTKRLRMLYENTPCGENGSLGPMQEYAIKWYLFGMFHTRFEPYPHVSGPRRGTHLRAELNRHAHERGCYRFSIPPEEIEAFLAIYRENGALFADIYDICNDEIKHGVAWNPSYRHGYDRYALPRQCMYHAHPRGQACQIKDKDYSLEGLEWIDDTVAK